MTDKQTTVNSDLIPAEQQFFSQMIEDHSSIKVDVIGTEEGFEVMFKTSTSRRYILHTQRKSVRRFKSPSTLFSFLSEIGVKNISVRNLDLCASDTYVRKNSTRHQKRIKASQQQEEREI
jgi:hypothetical protein